MSDGDASVPTIAVHEPSELETRQQRSRVTHQGGLLADGQRETPDSHGSGVDTSQQDWSTLHHLRSEVGYRMDDLELEEFHIGQPAGGSSSSSGAPFYPASSSGYSQNHGSSLFGSPVTQSMIDDKRAFSNNSSLRYAMSDKVRQNMSSRRPNPKLLATARMNANEGSVKLDQWHKPGYTPSYLSHPSLSPLVTAPQLQTTITPELRAIMTAVGDANQASIKRKADEGVLKTQRKAASRKRWSGKIKWVLIGTFTVGLAVMLICLVAFNVITPKYARGNGGNPVRREGM